MSLSRGERLSADEDFDSRRRTLIEAKVAYVPNLRRVLEATDNCICHWVPNPTNPQRRHSIAAPTTFVKRLLMQRLDEMPFDDADKVLYCLRDAVAAASFRGTLFEIGVLEELNNGCALTARQLSGGGPKTSECDNSPPSRTVSSTATAKRISPLQAASSMFPAETFAPINSFYCPKPSGTTSTNERGILWLLLVTVEQTRPVNGEELAKTLELLGMLETIKKDPQRAALAFVVPEENFSSFGPQEINLGISNDEDDVAKLRQIGDKMRKSLREVGIDTIGDLRKRLAMEKENNPNPRTKLAEGLSVATLRRLLAKHDEKQQWGALDSIPQFVWGADMDDKYLRSRDATCLMPNDAAVK
ncbi:hypothetical protein PR001_g6498 [Phytophthora rubi]|uniref:Uncharacterized protein n=1 Tax=Phytophthora rubi TaxID=129364 RepID=A0A6A3NED2_9STRA|nr:hypothetical protein PR001_g6498 [Phytophthora rubi]